MKSFTIAVLSLVLFVIALPAFSQAPPDPSLIWPNEFVAAGGGHDQASGGLVFAALAKKTPMTNGSNNFPSYSYSEVIAQRVNGKIQNTITTGFLFPFFDRMGLPIPVLGTQVLKALRFTVAAGGGVGVGQSTTQTAAVTSTNYGFVWGAQTFLRIARPSSKLGFEVGANPMRGGGGLGVHASRWTVGATYTIN